MKHEHRFTIHIGLPVFGRTATAWVPETLVSGDVTDCPQMMRCRDCGEQGYEVPA